jgi:CubicO group peptidase (beta-lactamase class C family)
VYRGTIRTEVAAGSKWAYANHGFVVLGQLVEDISGEPFSEHMRRRLFDPLGMASTEYLRTERTAGDVATGYHWLFGRYRSVRDYDLSILGAGAVLSSLTDMATYAAWLAYGAAGTPSDVLAPGTLEEMMAPQYAIDPRLSGLGLAFFLGRIGEHPVVGHDGNIPGFASTLLVAPEEKLGVVVLTNTATLLGAGQLGAMVMRSLLGVADPMAGRQGAGVLERPHLWGDLVGYYAPRPGFLTNLRAWQMLGGEVQVVIRQRHLTITALSPVGQLRRGLRLQAADHADPLRFSFEYDGQLVQIAFGRGDNGQVDRVAIGRPVSVMLHRRPTWRSSGLRLRLFAAAGLVALRRARLRRSARRGRR